MLGILLAVFAEGSRADAQVDSALGGNFSDAPQAEARTGVPTIHAGTHLVALDVVVTGAHGRTVPGLTKEDFHLFEDGQEQTVKIFEEHAPIDPALLAQREAAITARLPPNTFTNYEPPSGDSVTMLLLNELLPLGEYDWDALRAQMLHTVVAAPAGTPFVIFELDDQLRLVQGMTTNRQVLLEAVNGLWDKIHFAPSLGNTAPLVLLRRKTLTGAVQQLDNYVASLPGKKTLLAFTGGLQWTLALPPPSTDLRNYLCSVMDVAEQGRISIYRIYPNGQAVYGFACESGGNTSLDDVYNSRYYTLYYTPTNGDWDGSYRNFKVTLNDKKLHASYRPGYYGRQENGAAEVAPSEEADVRRMGLPAPAAMGMGAGHLAPVVFTVTVAPSAAATEDSRGGYRDVKATYAIGASELKLAQEAEPGAAGPAPYKAHLEITALLYNRGRVVDAQQRQVFATFADPRIQSTGVTGELNLRIPEKRVTSVRFFLHDAIADRSGEIDVPISKMMLFPKKP